MSEILFFIPEPIFFQPKSQILLGSKGKKGLVYKFRNQATLLVMRVRVKVPFRVKRDNLSTVSLRGVQRRGNHIERNEAQIKMKKIPF
jgi:hypothetical protein